MDNNLNIETVHVCRTCMQEIIINTSFFHLDFTQVDGEVTIGQKLFNCIPELDLNIVPNALICGKCTDTINSFYLFKKECLRLETQIREYTQQVQHIGGIIDLAGFIQFHQFNSKDRTADLTMEAFEKTENHKIEDATTYFYDDYAFNETEENTATGIFIKTENYKYEELHSENLITEFKTEAIEKNEESSTSFYDNYNFNETKKYTEISSNEYLTSLEKVDTKCVLFNTVEDLFNAGKSDAEENHKTLLRWYKCDLCNYSTRHKCLFSLHSRAHLTKNNYQRILKSRPVLVKHSTNTTTFDKKDSKANKINYGSPKSNKHHLRYWYKSLSKYSKSKQDCKQYNISELAIDPNIRVKQFKCCICKICGYSTNYKYNLKSHMLTHIDEKRFKCSICKYSFNRKSILNRHMLTHTGDKPFKCSICEYSCNRKSNLKCHMLIHSGEKPFKCSVCEFSSNQKSILNRHTLTHTSEKLFKCSICEFSSNHKHNLRCHMLTHTGEKPFKCSLCEFASNQKSILMRHMLTHTVEKLCKCSICDYSCNHKQSLKCHMLTHTGEKPFKCSFCEFRSNQKSILKRHTLTHTGEKPFKCSICEFSSNHKHNLKYHMLTHTGEKPFKCSLCEFSSNQKSILKRHMLTHTGEKLFKCSICDYSCNYKQSFKRHMLAHTGEKP